MRLAFNDHELFFKEIRMNPILEELIKLVLPLIRRDSTGIEAPKESLGMTLRYLASGNFHVSLATSHRISQTTISRTIQEICEALWIREGLLDMSKNEMSGKVLLMYLKDSGIFQTA